MLGGYPPHPGERRDEHVERPRPPSSFHVELAVPGRRGEQRALVPAEADARYPDVDGERHHTFLFAIDDDVVIDAAVNGNEARFINHSCDPNCDAVIDGGKIWIDTIREVMPGEELAYDYAYELEERHSPAAKKRFPCHCGAAICRGTILAKKR